MTIRVSFDLGESDLRHFQSMMQRARDAGQARSQAEVLAGTRRLIDSVRRVAAPEFVRQRIDLLQTMIAMVEDEQWELGGEDVARVISALVYFCEPEDLVADHVPLLGYLDDAIMIELVARELRHELEAFRDFSAFREAAVAEAGRASGDVTRQDWLAAKRKELQSRMRRRRLRDAARRGWRSLFGQRSARRRET